MADQQDQLQRAFNKLIQACPKEWSIAQQGVLIEDLNKENEALRKQVSDFESADKTPAEDN